MLLVFSILGRPCCENLEKWPGEVELIVFDFDS